MAWTTGGSVRNARVFISLPRPTLRVGAPPASRTAQPILNGFQPSYEPEDYPEFSRIAFESSPMMQGNWVHALGATAELFGRRLGWPVS